MTGKIMDSQSEYYDEVLNPLDSVEEVLSSNNWVYDRMTSDELVVRVTGKSCDYRLFFIWQENMNAMQFCCQYEMSIPVDNIQMASAVLMDVNASLWLGHFEISRDTCIPTFRQTSLFAGMNQTDHSDKIENLVDISLAQCERYHSVFHLLSREGGAQTDSLSLALMDTAGES